MKLVNLLQNVVNDENDEQHGGCSHRFEQVLAFVHPHEVLVGFLKLSKN